MNKSIRHSAATNFKVGDKINLTIDRLSYDGGRGVCRYQDFVFFVPNTAPEEQVSAEITQIKKNYGEARLVEVLLPSKHRRIPACPIVNECGGCGWQHITYDEQIRQKQGLIKHQLKVFLTPANSDIQIKPAPNEYRYRNRVQIHAAIGINEKINFGFFKKGTNQIVPTKDCLIADENLFKDLEPALARVIKNSITQKVELALDGAGKRVLRNLSETESEFTQVNSAQNNNLKKYVVGAVELYNSKNKFKNIYDLYCGDGNLTAPIAAQFPAIKIIGVEQNAGAISRANQTRPQNVQYFSQDVLSHLKKISKAEASAFILDPARAGLGQDTCEQISRLKPTLIVYVSCSLPSLARDLFSLTKGGYELVSVHGFDMFPQTEYIETVSILLPRAIQGFC